MLISSVPVSGSNTMASNGQWQLQKGSAVHSYASQPWNAGALNLADLTLACVSSVRLCSYSVRLCSYPVAGRILLRVPRLFVTEVDPECSEQVGAIGQYLDHARSR